MAIFVIFVINTYNFTDNNEGSNIFYTQSQLKIQEQFRNDLADAKKNEAIASDLPIGIELTVLLM